jgi:ElaA protein
MSTALHVAVREFGSLSPHALYDILRLRSQVFVVEQQCIFLDPDNRDQDAWHVTVTDDAGVLLACARVLRPGAMYDEPSVGRVVSAPEARGTGAGKAIMHAALDACASLFPGSSIRIGAQKYLSNFYGALGFVQASEPYLEDGIEHIEMLRPPQRRASD